MNKEHPSTIGQDAEKYLLTLARETIARHLKNDRQMISRSEQFPQLNEPRGAFVTLHERESMQLRGCIGIIEAIDATIIAVQKMAIAAAARDPRFEPLKPAELNKQIIEISLLEAPRPLSDLDQIVIGRDGLIVEKKRNRGLLLPQVASDRGWDKETFFSQTLVKAGLSPHKETFQSVKTLVFSAYHFSESNDSSN